MTAVRRSFCIITAGTRSTEHLRNFLSAYQGTLVSDGYQPYHTFSEEQALASAGLLDALPAQVCKTQ